MIPHISVREDDQEFVLHIGGAVLTIPRNFEGWKLAASLTINADWIAQDIADYLDSGNVSCYNDVQDRNKDGTNASDTCGTDGRTPQSEFADVAVSSSGQEQGAGSLDDVAERRKLPILEVME